jgi:class 3 adenylate cyclase
MATFSTPTDGMRAALSMHTAMNKLNATTEREDLVVKIGLHEGPALVVTVNDRIDYFGQTVNIASRVQGLATATSLFTTQQVVSNAGVKDVLAAAELAAVARQATLKGIRDEVTVYEIPLR